MKDMEADVELSPNEEELLRSLNRELEPPPELEPQVVAALRRRDLVRSPGRRGGIRLQTWQALAAALVLAVAGFLAGRLGVDQPADPPSDSPRFLLLLYEDPTTPASEETALRQFEEYSAWAGELAQRGAFEGGDPIDAEGHLLRRIDGRVRAAPGTEPAGGEVLTGYFMIRARDKEEALRTARQCPHLNYDGTVAVRPVGEP